MSYQNINMWNKKTDRYKYGNVMLSGMIVAVITYIPWVYNVFSVFGCAGLSSPANSLQMFFRVPVWIPLSAVIIAFLYFICCIFGQSVL